ncbi:alpha-E domain-containing protein [Thermithiobacillus plumbiphilus]|uniref:Alpha-E domain-containing protein n=1 Tax=Thermithiobacillus plumbiphilus TaxID=1729899 RepID=A0ABU9D7Q7_9PROT
MLSRNAESVYWLARNLERAENTARLINVTSILLLDLPADADLVWQALLDIIGTDPRYRQSTAQADEEGLMEFLIRSDQNPNSILACLKLARDNARGLREILPRETWEQINELYLYARDSLGATLDRGKRFDRLTGLIRRRQAIVGMLAGSMSHDAPYQFLRLGRNLERADMTSRILDVNSSKLLSTNEIPTLYFNLRWMAVLRSLDAYQAYRRHVEVRVRGADVIEFLLRHPHFPRSVLFCLLEVDDCLQVLPRSQAARTSISVTLDNLATLQPDALVKDGLHAALDCLQQNLRVIHEALSETYFRYDCAPRPAPVYCQSQTQN